MSEWDQFIIIDLPDLEEGHKIKKGGSNQYYSKQLQYSQYNPLEILYEETDEDFIHDTIVKSKGFSKCKHPIHNKLMYWGEVFIKTIFTGFLVYTVFI
jgi:hypothetical protein